MNAVCVEVVRGPSIIRSTLELRRKGGEKLAAAGIFPFQGFAKRVGIASNQDQPDLARTMLRRAFTDLPGRREMNETVGPVFGGTRDIFRGLPHPAIRLHGLYEI